MSVKSTEDMKKILFGSVRPEKPEEPTKVTVVGVGQVGMACSISLLLKVGTTVNACNWRDSTYPT